MENNSNAFKFDPIKLEKSFTDKNGTSKIEMESDGAYLNMPESVTLANRPKTKILTKEIKTTKEGANIGIGSNGFAGDYNSCRYYCNSGSNYCLFNT